MTKAQLREYNRLAKARQRARPGVVEAENEARRERYATDPDYRADRLAQKSDPDRENELRRERYATDAEYREAVLEANRESYHAAKAKPAPPKPSAELVQDLLTLAADIDQERVNTGKLTAALRRLYRQFTQADPDDVLVAPEVLHILAYHRSGWMGPPRIATELRKLADNAKLAARRAANRASRIKSGRRGRAVR